MGRRHALQLGAARLLTVGQRLAALFDCRWTRDVHGGRSALLRRALVDAMAALGVTRVSLGVQDFDVGVQQAINRLQSPELTAAAIARLRASRHSPLQSRPGLWPAAANARHAVAHARSGDRAAARQVRGVRLCARSLDEAAPGADRCGDAARCGTCERPWPTWLPIGWSAAGYRPDWPRPLRPAGRRAGARRCIDARLRRNFQGYVADRNALGRGDRRFGDLLPAAGFHPECRTTVAYMAAIERGGTCDRARHCLVCEDRLRGDIINALMCHFEADLGRSAAITRRRRYRHFCRRLPDLSSSDRDGLIVARRDAPGRHRTGRPLVRSVCARLRSLLHRRRRPPCARSLNRKETAT